MVAPKEKPVCDGVDSEKPLEDGVDRPPVAGAVVGCA